MTDVLVLFLIAGFLAACLAYVQWCDRIIGPDPTDLDDLEDDEQASGLERDAVAR